MYLEENKSTEILLVVVSENRKAYKFWKFKFIRNKRPILDKNYLGKPKMVKVQ